MDLQLKIAFSKYWVGGDFTMRPVFPIRKMTRLAWTEDVIERNTCINEIFHGRIGIPKHLRLLKLKISAGNNEAFY